MLFFQITAITPTFCKKRQLVLMKRSGGVTVSSHDSTDIIKIVIGGVFSCIFHIFFCSR